MYLESAALCRKVIIYIGFFILVGTASDVAASWWPTSFVPPGVSLVNWIVLSYIAFVAVLSDHVEQQSNVVSNFIGFALKSFGLIVLTMVLPTAFFFLLPIVPSATDVESQTSSAAWSEFYFQSIILLAQVLTVVVFALLGTTLAAQVTRHQQGLGETFRQGKRAFLRTAGLLLAGPFVFEIIAYGGELWATYLSTGSAFAHEDSLDILSPDWKLNGPVAIVVLGSQALYAVSAITTAWVLSNTYLATAEHLDIAAVFE